MDTLSTVGIVIVVIVVLAIGYYVMKPEKR